MASPSGPLDMVTATEPALALLRRLRDRHGPLMFHQSGGCCDGSSPMCYPLGEFRVGPRDVQMGEVDGCPYYIDADQFERWKHTRLTLDVVKGRGAGFSLETPEGVRFLIRSDLCEVVSPSGPLSEAAERARRGDR